MDYMERNYAQDLYEFAKRVQDLRNNLIKQNFWTVQSIDEDIIPYIESIEDLEDYENCLYEGWSEFSALADLEFEENFVVN